MLRTYRWWAALFAWVALSLWQSYTPVWAHGHLDVGEYELTIGFRNEPAYQGEPNGLDLRVVNHDTEEPIVGLEETLQVAIIYGESTQELELRARFGQEGSYTADVLPTQTGDYTWHIWGEIEGEPVDVRMTSGPDTFSSVEPKSSVSFPDAEPSLGDVQSELQSLGRSAQIALLLGGLGAVLGLIAGVMSWRKR